MYYITKRIAVLMALVLLLSSCLQTDSFAAKKVKLNKTKITMKVGDTFKLKLKNNKKKIKWSSSKKKIVSVSKKGVLKAKKIGKSTITAKVGKKKYKCKVKVAGITIEPTARPIKKKEIITTDSKNETTKPVTTYPGFTENTSEGSSEIITTENTITTSKEIITSNVTTRSTTELMTDNTTSKELITSTEETNSTTELLTDNTTTKETYATTTNQGTLESVTTEQSTPDISKPNAPEGLIFEELYGYCVEVSWVASDDVDYYSAYINGEYLATTSSNSIFFHEGYFPDYGKYNIEVSAFKNGIESDRVSVVYTKSIWKYSVVNDEVTIEKYRGNTEDGPVVIPSTIEGKTVTKIANNAFYKDYGIESVVIPDSIVSIGSKAFYDCIKLRSINNSLKNIKTIGDYAFYLCGQLSEDIVLENLCDMGKGAFYGCNSIKSIESLSNITSISESAFRYCRSISKIDIPIGVTSIGSYAFAECSSLCEINIPDGVTSIGSYAFYGCTSLREAIIPDGLTSIEEETYSGCTSLKNIVIPMGVTKIGNFAFRDCGYLNKIVIPSSVKSIGETLWYGEELPAFYGDYVLSENYTNDSGITIGGLTICDAYYDGMVVNNNTIIYYDGDEEEVVIPNSITGIGDRVFQEKTNLSVVVLPSTLESIGYDAFYNCSNLEEVQMPEPLNNLKTIESSAFQGCSKLTSFEIPDSVSEIGSYIFEGSGITTIVIPSSIDNSKLSYDAFSGCSNVNKIIISNGVSNLNNKGLFTGYMIESSSFINNSTLDSEDYNYWGAMVYDNYLDGFYMRNNEVLLYKPVEGYDYDDYNNIIKNKEIVIPAGTTRIGNSIFGEYKPYINKIIIPSTVIDIGEYAFGDESDRVFIDKANIINNSELDAAENNYWGARVYDTYYDGLYICDNNIIYSNLSKTSVVDLTIPEGTLSIGCVLVDDNCGVLNAGYLNSLTIPGTISSVERIAGEMTNIKKVILNNGVKSIKANAFYYSNVGTINIPASCSNVESNAFNNTYVENVIFDDGMTSINCDNAFAGGVGSVTIPRTVTSISEHAFEDGYGSVASSTCIKGYAGSYAEVYANEHNISFQSVDE